MMRGELYDVQSPGFSPGVAGVGARDCTARHRARRGGGRFCHHVKERLVDVGKCVGVNRIAVLIDDRLMDEVVVRPIDSAKTEEAKGIRPRWLEPSRLT